MNLDKNQLKIIENKSKRVMVIAAPGSGKTSTLIGRARFLINHGEDPSSILLLTFTTSAALNMRERLNCKGEGPFIGTFHSFSYKILKSRDKSINIIKENEKNKEIKEIFNSFGYELKRNKLNEINNNLMVYKRTKEYKGEIDENIFISLYEKYEKYMEENNLIDFDDMEIMAFHILEEDESILERVRKRYKHILVDEFQDIDLLEVNILKKIGEESSLFCVGDEDQSIFSFRGARPDFTVDFKKIFKNGEIYYLGNNYRSREDIVNKSKALIKHNIIRSNKEINNIKPGGKVEIIKVKDYKEEGEKILNLLNNLQDTGILYRKKEDAIYLSLVLLEKGILFSSPFDPLDFIKEDILSYKLLAKNRYLKNIFIKIINKPYRFISRITLLKLDRVILEKDIFKTLYSFKDISLEEYKKLKIFERDLDKLSKIKEGEKEEFILEKMGYENYIGNKYGGVSLKKILSIGENKTNNNIYLTSIHRAKGREYKNVIILNCSKSNMPNYKNKNIEEERRVFYVGLTRGIDRVYLIEREDMGSPSPFLLETMK